MRALACALVLVSCGVAFGSSAYDPTVGSTGATGPGAATASPRLRANGARTVDLYGVDSTTGSLLKIDKNTGSAAVIGTVGVSVVGALAWDPSTEVCYGTDTSTPTWDLITVDLASGATNVIGGTNVYFPHGAAVDPVTGILYAEDIWNGELYSLDKTTGAKTLIGISGIGNLGALDFDPTTGLLYGATADPFGLGKLFIIDTATGAATFVTNTYRFTGIAFDETGYLYGVDNGFLTGAGSALYSIDKVTGAYSLIANLGFDNVLCLCFATAPAPFARFRNAGANPGSYTATTLPRLGTTYVATVNVGGTTGHNFAWLVGYGGPATLPLGGGQIVLVDPFSGPELLNLPLVSGPVATYIIPIPADVGFVGLRASTQAAHVGGIQPYALSNAQDLVLGW